MNPDERCHYCGGGGPDDQRRFGLRELRPYGPGGAMVCYECAHSTPERRAETEGAMGALMDAASAVGGGVATIGTKEGPMPGVNLGDRDG